MPVSVEVADTERAGSKLTKKWFVAGAVLSLILSLAGLTFAHNSNSLGTGEKIERSLPVSAEAVITLCVASGTLKVSGWERNEIRVRSQDAAQIEFRRIDRTRHPVEPASRVDVMVFDRVNTRNPKVDCVALASVEMDVPAGSTVQVQTRDGDISIAGVAAVYAGSQNGEISIEGATKLVEAGSVGGSIYLKESSGRINLSSAGGGVEVMNVKPSSSDDTLEVGTVSGDIQLEHVSNPKVTVKTVNGTVTMVGPLAKSGWYGFTNMTGNIVLALPSDASFELNAKISEKNELISDFVLKDLKEPATPAPPSPPAPVPDRKPKADSTPAPVVAPIVVVKPALVIPYSPRRINARCGTGDATISIASFGGTVRLKKI